MGIDVGTVRIERSGRVWGRPPNKCRGQHDGDAVVVYWLRCRGYNYMAIARFMGWCKAMVHKALKKCERVLTYTPPDLSDPLAIRLYDLPLPQNLRGYLAEMDLIMARDVAAVPLDKLTLQRQMGPVRLGRLYYTLKELGVEFHPSWRMIEHGHEYIEVKRRWVPRPESDVLKAWRSGLRPYR